MSRSLVVAAVDRCLSVSTAADAVTVARQAIDDPRLDWLAVVALANKHLVGPALWTSLSRAELSDLVPADVRDYLTLLHARNAARNARIRSQCESIGAILARAGVRTALLKGATWLFEDAAPAASDRMMRDIDLGVEPDEFEAAVAALKESGYRDVPDIFIEPDHIHHAPMLREGAEACVEIHRDLAGRADFLSTKEVLAAAREVAPGLLLPEVRHRIAHNVIHAQIQNGDFAGGVLNLRDGLDLARLVAGCGAQFDWAALAGEARARGYFRQLSGAINGAHRIFRSPLPPPFAADLRGRLHAWRCVEQRRWPPISRVFELLGPLTRALAWERDAYALGLQTRRSLRAQILVNKRRAQRAIAALRSLSP